MSAARLCIPLKPSRLLCAYILASHALAALAVTLTALPQYWRCTVLAFLIVHLAWRLKKHWRDGEICLCYDFEDKAWSYSYNGNDAIKYALDARGDQVLWPWLLVLNFRRTDGRRLALTLLPDAADDNDLRRLRVLLRYGH